MNDFQKHVTGRDQRPKDIIVTEAIEKNKKEKEEFPKKLELPPKPFLFASLLLFFKKILNFFVKEKTLGTQVSKQQLIDDLKALRKVLQILEIEDQSHNPEYTFELSEKWHRLKRDLIHFEHQKDTSLETSKVKVFIDSVQNYPPGEDHSLGSYLTEYAGKDWLPFPFMEILQRLHRQHLEKPQDSILSDWIGLLNEAISSLDFKANLSS